MLRTEAECLMPTSLLTARAVNRVYQREERSHQSDPFIEGHSQVKLAFLKSHRFVAVQNTGSRYRLVPRTSCMLGHQQFYPPQLRPICAHGNGVVTKSWCYYRDVCRAYPGVPQVTPGELPTGGHLVSGSLRLRSVDLWPLWTGIA